MWLEEIEGAEALAWVEAQNGKTLARLSDSRTAADAAALKAMMDRPDKIPHITRRGGLLYNYWQDAQHPRGLWRRTTLASYRSDSPDWELLLDLDALAAEEGEDWIWKGATTLPPAHDRALLRLSRGGGDAVVLREFDLGSRSFVPGGFDLPEGKSNAAWLDRDTLILSSALGDGMATQSGYARAIRRWSRGQDPMAAPVLFEVPAEHMGAWAGIDRSSAEERVVFLDQIGFFDVAVHLGDREGPRLRIDLPTDLRLNWEGDQVVLQPRTPWAVDGTTYPPDMLLGTRLSALLDGQRSFTRLFEPAERRALEGFFWCDGRVVVSVLDDLRPDHTIWTPAESGWTCRRLEGLPEIGVVSVWPMDAEAEESDGTLLAMTQDPLTPPTLLQTATTPAAPLVLRQAPRLFNAQGLRVTRHEAISSDGERIPYVQTGPEQETGDAPVHMTGYGGFQVTMSPTYRGSTGQLWLERGGTAVLAHIRGGGEFGTRWHEAGRREKKHLSHDDFAAVAADLVRRGVTVPGRIAAEGGSNGGLLIANMLTRYPERFGALFCTIPLIDMRRYTKLLAGASWIAEYGDPDKPEDWAFMRQFAAYHAAEPGRPYPPILLATTRRDDRVHPGHARKMAAKLQKLGYDARFYEPTAGGHGYGKDNAEAAQFMALGAAFLRRAIGWESE
nr:prolyl oligopeptidase family serine peptidase [Roseomonas marmotae]